MILSISTKVREVEGREDWLVVIEARNSPEYLEPMKFYGKGPTKSSAECEATEHMKQFGERLIRDSNRLRKRFWWGSDND